MNSMNPRMSQSQMEPRVDKCTITKNKAGAEIFLKRSFVNDDSKDDSDEDVDGDENEDEDGDQDGNENADKSTKNMEEISEEISSSDSGEGSSGKSEGKSPVSKKQKKCLRVEDLVEDNDDESLSNSGE